jgi:uncharacterized protein (TIGR00251 family)
MDFSIIPVKIVPRSSKNQIVGWQGDVLKIKIKSPPVDGEANAELVRFLAEALDIPKSKIEIIKGQSAKNKLLRIYKPDILAELKRIDMQ